MEGKERKVAEAKTPDEQRAREEAEKKARLNAMPEWKRNILVKKQYTQHY